MSMGAEMVARESRVRSLESALRKANDEIAVLREEVTSLRTEKVVLTAHNRGLKRELAQTDAKILRMREEVDAANDAVAQLQQRLARMLEARQ